MTDRPPSGTFFLPGPTEVRGEVLAAMTCPMMPHRGAAFESLFARIQDGTPARLPYPASGVRQLELRDGADGRRGALRAAGARALIGDRRFLNQRAQDHWALRGLLETDQIALPRDERLMEESLAIQVVGKDSIRKTLGRSPDALDSVMGLSQTVGMTRRYASVVPIWD